MYFEVFKIEMDYRRLTTSSPETNDYCLER